MRVYTQYLVQAIKLFLAFTRLRLLCISDGFDIVVNDCFAHNGATKRIQLIDEYG